MGKVADSAGDYTDRHRRVKPQRILTFWDNVTRFGRSGARRIMQDRVNDEVITEQEAQALLFSVGLWD